MAVQVSFVVDKQTLESFGFSMVPEAAIKLAGAPECQSTEVTFTVLSAKARVPPGLLELTLPLYIKGGPAVLLTLRALLVVPEVVPSDSVLDFGIVSTGHCKVRQWVQECGSISNARWIRTVCDQVPNLCLTCRCVHLHPATHCRPLSTALMLAMQVASCVVLSMAATGCKDM